MLLILHLKTNSISYHDSHLQKQKKDTGRQFKFQEIKQIMDFERIFRFILNIQSLNYIILAILQLSSV